jgi:hypothetical protein
VRRMLSVPLLRILTRENDVIQWFCTCEVTMNCSETGCEAGRITGVGRFSKAAEWSDLKVDDN